ncbi:MAG: peptidase M64 [Bacteroidales bacterium]|nr:peptidase M64 [Bacteroidales bacterium]
MRHGILTILAMVASVGLWAQSQTLRLDYIFSGTDKSVEISLDEAYCFDGWAGRTVNLKKVHLRGNGQICMTDVQTGDTLYRQSFSTLFQEWQATEEATKVRKSFENVFLLPMPTAEAEVKVMLYDFWGNVVASLSHKVDPKDVLIHHLSPKTPEHKYLMLNGTPEEKIDVAIVAEGYTAEEMDTFYADAQAAMEAILAHEPFGQYKDRFNFVAVALESAESGVSVPGRGEWKDTALKSHFNTFYMDRYLTTLRLKNMHDKLCGVPYEHIVILANTDTYGGGGIYNSYTLTTAHHPAFKPVVVHEFGHSFAGLGDEYYYDDQYVEYYYPEIEPWEQNITTLADFESKWKDMLEAGEAELLEGGGYQSKGVYRPAKDCRMHTNRAESFCPVCQRALGRIIEFYTAE